MVEVVLLRSSADGGVCPQGLKSPPFLAVLDGAASRAAASAEEKGLYSLLKKSAFGWRSAFSAALKSLLSAGALAPEVLEFRFSANCLAPEGTPLDLQKVPDLFLEFLGHHTSLPRSIRCSPLPTLAESAPSSMTTAHE